MLYLSLDLFNMEAFFPSEVARLVLGYLKEEKCLKSWQTFMEESTNLEEYCNLYKKGRVYSTNVNGISLLDILNEYCVLKSKVESCGNDKLECPGKAQLTFESEFLKSMRNDTFAETTKNAIDSVFQKYISSVLNNRNNLSSNSSTEVCLSKSSNNSSKNVADKNSHCTDTEESNTNESGEKQNKTYEIKNKIINRNKNKTQNIIIDDLNNNKPAAELNISKRSNNSPLKQLKVSKNKDLQSSCTVTDIKSKHNSCTFDLISRQFRNSDSLINDPSVNVGCDKDLHWTKNKSTTSVENQSTSIFECTVNVNDSSTESTQSDDDGEVEIIKEVKSDNLSDRIQSKQSSACQNNIRSNSLLQNSDTIINIEANNNVPINHAASVAVQSIVTEVSNSKQKVILPKSNSVKNTVTNNNSAVVCNGPNEAIQINSVVHKGNSSNDQTCFNISTSPFINQPAVIDKMSITSPRFILPNYSSNGSFINNNGQFYIVLNTPVAPDLSGALMTVPSIQANVPNPVLPAVSSTGVKNSVPAPVSSVSNPMSAVALSSPVNQPVPLAASNTSIANAHGNFLTVSNISRPDTTAKSTERRSQATPRILKKVSYVDFSDEDTERDETNSSKTCKRKKTQQKRSSKKKTNKKDSVSLADQPVQDQKASMSQKHNTGENGFLISVVSESQNNKKKTKKKSPHKKIKDLSEKYLEVKKTKQGASYSKFENHFMHNPVKQQICPSNPLDVTNCGIPSSSCSKTHNNSQFITKSVPENTNQSAILNENRILKVVLSDMFSESNLGLDKQNKGNKDQTRGSKLVAKNRRSHRIRKEDAKHPNISKRVDTTKLQQRIKETKPDNPPLITYERKLHPSDKRSEPNNSSSIDMTTAVLNSMEQARQLVTDPKKHFESPGLKDVNSQNSSKHLTAQPLEPKSAFQRVIQDMCENAECTELIIIDEFNDKNGKNISLNMPKSSVLSSSVGVEKNFKCSMNESSEYGKKLRCHNVNSKMVSKERPNECKNIASVSKNSDLEICSNISAKLFEQDLKLNKETEKNISLEISKKGSSDTIKVEKEVAVSDCIKEKKRFLTKSLSSLHQVNVNRRMKTSIFRKLNFGVNHLDFNSRPLINESFYHKTVKKEDSRNFSHEIFDAESNAFKSVNIKNECSDLIHETSETNVFSVLTSISTNTKVLGIADTHDDVTQPHSDILSVSSLRGGNTVNVMLPSTSNHSLESEKCNIIKNLFTKCDETDKGITDNCTVEEKSASTVLLSSSIS